MNKNINVSNILYVLVIIVSVILSIKIIKYINTSIIKKDKFYNTENNIKTECVKCNDKINEINNEIMKLQLKCKDKNCKDNKDIEELKKKLDKQKCDCNVVCLKENLKKQELELEENNAKLKKCKTDVECENVKKIISNIKNSSNKNKENLKYYECSCANCLSLKGGYNDVDCILKVCKDVGSNKLNVQVNGKGEIVNSKIVKEQADKKKSEEQKKNIEEVKQSTMILNNTGSNQTDLISESEKLLNNNNGRSLSKEKNNRSILVEAKDDNIEFAESRKDVGGVINSSLGYSGYNSYKDDKGTNNLKVITKKISDNKKNGTQIVGKVNEQQPLILKSDKDNSDIHMEDLLEYGGSKTSLGQYDFGMQQGSNTVNAVANVDLGIEEAHIHKNNIREAPIIHQSGVSGVSNIFAPHIIVNDSSGNLHSDSGNTYDSSTTNGNNPSLGADMSGIPGLQGAKELEAIYFAD